MSFSPTMTSARTLVKEGALRLTLMGLAADGVLPPHSNRQSRIDPILDGDVIFYALDKEYALFAGDVLIYAARVEHAAQSVRGAPFLLTVAHISPPGDTPGRDRVSTFRRPRRTPSPDSGRAAVDKHSVARSALHRVRRRKSHERHRIYSESVAGKAAVSRILEEAHAIVDAALGGRP